MLRLSDEQAREVAAAVAAARGRADLRAAVADVYRRVQAEVDERRPVCSVSGRCCHFEAYGHRLFVTTIELAAFADQLPLGQTNAPLDGLGCPFQVEGLCGAHAIRPFGCRIYFCDHTSTDWQQSLYERFHAELKALHERASVPYFYVEWREGLRSAGLAGGHAGADVPPSVRRTRLPVATDDRPIR